MTDKPGKYQIPDGLDVADAGIDVDLPQVHEVTPTLAERVVSIQIVMQIGSDEKTLSALASTDADPYKIARGLLAGLREDANGWLIDRES